MEEKKQLWKGIAIGFAATLIVIQAVMFASGFLPEILGNNGSEKG